MRYSPTVMRPNVQLRRLARVAVSALLGLVAACDGQGARPKTAASLGPSPSSTALGPFVDASASEASATVPINAADPVWGDRRAPVTLVVFGDLECPYTAKVLPTLRALRERYGAAGLRIVWKDDPLPFHPQARPAAEAAETVFALGQSPAFWRFWDQALEHQADLSLTALEGWASSAGVDLASYRQALAAHASAAKVDGDLVLAQRLKVQGTPTFFVNGTLLVGAQPVAKFADVIDAEAEKAKAKLAAGVAPDALYAEMTRVNWKAPVDEPEGDDDKEDTTTVWRVPIGPGPVRGRPDAPVTIVLFSDFQCPYCKRVEPTLKQVRDVYGDKVRIVWRDAPLPFHKRARPAAELAREARTEKGDPGFWAAHDALFDSQPNLSDDDLMAVGRAVGLDAARLKGALAGERYAAQIQADLDAADDVQVDGTPAMFINGRRFSGAQPFEAIRPLIDDELRHTADLLAQGVAPAALYDTLMKTAKTPPIGEVRRAPPRAGAPFRGLANGPVVIEEFADFQCPYCARADDTLGQLVKRYGAKIKLVWRNFPLPFHAHAEEAAEAALEAQKQKGNAGFWAMHDKMFAHQGEHGAGLDRRALDGYARDLGMDVAAFDRALDGHAHQGEIQADMDAADQAQIRGTPAFIVGGYFVGGAQPFGVFRRIIDKVLESGPAEVAPAAR
jgi:protein-disulfide isomerase